MRLLRQYLGERSGEENLRAWFGRHTERRVTRNTLAGESVDPVERDLPAGPGAACGGGVIETGE